jgi:hypothetical protein
MKKSVKKLTIKKAQGGGKVIDKTATKKPTIKRGSLEQPTYKYLASKYEGGTPIKEDSLEYRKGFGLGRRGKGTGKLLSPVETDLGVKEGKEKKPFKKPVMKSGGKVIKKVTIKKKK